MFHGVTQRLQLPEVRGEVTVRRVRQGKGGRGREREGRNGKKRQVFREKKKDIIVQPTAVRCADKINVQVHVVEFCRRGVCVSSLYSKVSHYLTRSSSSKELHSRAPT